MEKTKESKCKACGDKGFEPDGNKCLECNKKVKVTSSKKKGE